MDEDDNLLDELFEPTPHEPIGPPLTNIDEAQRDFVVLRIRDNNTSHCFNQGDFVITAWSNAESKKLPYTYAYSLHHSDGQYLSKECVTFITELISDCPASFDVCRQVLAKFLQSPKSQKKLFMDYFHYHVARTQKARGLQVLTGLGMLFSQLTLIRESLNSKTDKAHFTFPLMARPCPVKPRHGFVESRIAKSIKDVNKILEETLAADPKGELVLMPPIDSEFSAVVTDSAITIGEGTDGATSGKKCTTIPCVSNLRYTLNYFGKYIYRLNKLGQRKRLNALRYAGIQKNVGVFLETVHDKVVQLRTGPAIDFAGTRYSTVSRVKPAIVYSVRGGMDFLEYEAYLDTLKVTYATHPWDVVIHHQDASLSSHYAVQAITRGFSVITDIKPSCTLYYNFKTGQISELIGLNSAYRKRMCNTLSLAYPIEPTSKTLTWAVSIIQGLAATSKTVISANLIVAAGIILAKAGIALCLGEHRHFFRCGPGKTGRIALAPVSFPLILNQHYQKGLLNRSEVYSEAFKLPWEQIATWQQMVSILALIEADYRAPEWSAGYGGIKWAECTKATNEIVLALMPFLLTTDTHPTLVGSTDMINKQILNLLAACNKLITISHNSAKCLTKIISTSTLHSITEGYTGLHIATSPLTWDIVK